MKPCLDSCIRYEHYDIFVYPVLSLDFAHPYVMGLQCRMGCNQCTAFPQGWDSVL